MPVHLAQIHAIIEGVLRFQGIMRNANGTAVGLVALAGCALVAGCTGPGTSAAAPRSADATATATASPSGSRSSVPSEPLAERVCGGARAAAAKALGVAAEMRIVTTQAADLRCTLTAGKVQLAVESQAGPRAYTEFDTESSHQSQVFGNGGINDPAQQPLPATVAGCQVAIWIPAQLLVAATDSTPTNGGAGAYVTVKVTGRKVPANTALRVAEATAGAVFAAHPDGPA